MLTNQPLLPSPMACAQALTGPDWSGLPLSRMVLPATPRSPLQRLKQPLLMTLLKGRVQIHRSMRGRVGIDHMVGASTLVTADAPAGGDLWSTTSPVEYVGVSLPVDTCAATLSDLPSWARPRAMPERFSDPKVTAWVGELHSHHAQGEPLGTLYTEAISTVLLTYLAARYGSHAQAMQPELSRRHRTGIEHVRRYIDGHLAERLALADLAALAGCSSAHLNRLFKAAHGQSVHRYVLDQRLTLARGLLLQPRIPLSEIALSCGFSSQAHLTTSFRTAVGITPGQYRNKG